MLRTTYIALGLSVLLFGSAAWGPWVSKAVWGAIERVQLAAARIVGGTLKSAPSEAVLLEADLCEVRRVAESQWVCEMEKCLRSGEENPRRDWGLRDVRRRLVRRGDWRGCARELLRRLLPEGVGRSEWVQVGKPWEAWKGSEWRIEGVKEGEVDKEKAVKLLEELGQVDLTLYTDGSAAEGVRCGGAGVVVTKGSAEKPERVCLLKCAAGTVTSSYQAELCALREAMKWLKENVSAWESVVVASDSQAALRAVHGVGTGRMEDCIGEIVELGRELGNLGKKMVFVWVPGHCGLIGNEWADKAAAEAAKLNQDGVACMLNSIRSLCRRRESVKIEHERCQRVYGEGMKRELEKGWTRADIVSMARLRSGHSLELGAYRKRIGLGGTGTCRRCEMDVEESLDHVMSCVSGARKRMELSLSDNLSVLCCRPREALDYWRWWRRVRLK